MENHYKRMVLLPEAEYIRLKQYTIQTDKNALVWPSETSIEREDKLYGLALAKRRETDKADAIASAATLAAAKEPPKKADFSGEILLFPATFRVRAQRLYKTLERHRPSDIDWKESGAVTFGRHGIPLEGTNLVDLIYHATAVKRRNFVPFGWTNFLEVLRRINVPLTLLGKDTQAEIHEPGEFDIAASIPLPAKPKPSRLPKRLQSSGPHRLKWIRV